MTGRATPGDKILFFFTVVCTVVTVDLACSCVPPEFSPVTLCKYDIAVDTKVNNEKLLNAEVTQCDTDADCLMTTASNPLQVFRGRLQYEAMVAHDPDPMAERTIGVHIETLFLIKAGYEPMELLIMKTHRDNDMCGVRFPFGYSFVSATKYANGNFRTGLCYPYIRWDHLPAKNKNFLSKILPSRCAH